MIKWASLEGHQDSRTVWGPQPHQSAEQPERAICSLGLGELLKNHVNVTNLEISHNARWFLLWPKIIGLICIKPSATANDLKAVKPRAAGLRGGQISRQKTCDIFFSSCEIKLDFMIFVNDFRDSKNTSQKKRWNCFLEEMITCLRGPWSNYWDLWAIWP
jgi:hypothetical protein